jgi:hypothetical protein
LTANAEAKIVVTPTGHFDLRGDLGPVIETLEKGEADTELQKWIASKLRRGGFASRKTLSQRIDEGEPLRYAIDDLEEIDRLLQRRYSKREARKRARLVVAFHWGVPHEDIYTYLKRGKNDPHRVL